MKTLQHLIERNLAWAKAIKDEDPEFFSRLSTQQAPEYLWIGCSDSRVPANRIGYSVLSVGQLKIMQEIITLTVFVPFAVFYMKEPLKLDFLWAGLCLIGAVYFMFRDKFA